MDAHIFLKTSSDSGEAPVKSCVKEYAYILDKNGMYHPAASDFLNWRKTQSLSKVTTHTHCKLTK